MSDDDRASRLRSRRGRARQRVEDRERAAAEVEEGSDATADAAERKTDPEGDAPDGADGGEATDSTGGSDGSVKADRIGTYMYLPESQKRELERVYGTLKVEYEYEYDEEFEKNRHFFPVVVRHGLETLDGMDAESVRELVEDL